MSGILKNFFFKNCLSSNKNKNEETFLKNIFKPDNNNNNNNNNINNNQMNKNKFENNNNNNKNEEKNFNFYNPQISFSQLPLIYKNSIEENWNGVKFLMNIKPTNLFQFDFSTIYNKNLNSLKNNFKSNSFLFFPFNNNNQNLILFNKIEKENYLIQSCFNYDNKNKINFIKNFPNKDYSNNINQIEFTHDFNRGNFSVKYNSNEPISFSTISNVYRNFFVGFEAFKIPEKKNFQIGYNYGIYKNVDFNNNNNDFNNLNNNNFNNNKNKLNNFFDKIGFSFVYLSLLPGYYFDLCLKLNKNFNFFFNYVKNKNSILNSFSNINNNEIKFFSNFKKNNIEIINEYNYSNNKIKLFLNFNIFKNLIFNWNFLFDAKEKKFNKKFKFFGIGINLNTTPFEDYIQNYINNNNYNYNIEDYNYENIINYNNNNNNNN